MGLTQAVVAQKGWGGWERVVKLPRKACRDQDKQLLPTESPHSTKGAELRTFKTTAPHTEAKADNLDNQVHKEGKPFQSPSCLQLWPMTSLPTTLVSRSAGLVKEWELSSGLRVQSSRQRSLTFPWGHLSYPAWCGSSNSKSLAHFK